MTMKLANSRLFCLLVLVNFSYCRRSNRNRHESGTSRSTSTTTIMADRAKTEALHLAKKADFDSFLYRSIYIHNEDEHTYGLVNLTKDGKIDFDDLVKRCGSTVIGLRYSTTKVIEPNKERQIGLKKGENWNPWTSYPCVFHPKAAPIIAPPIAPSIASSEIGMQEVKSKDPTIQLLFENIKILKDNYNKLAEDHKKLEEDHKKLEDNLVNEKIKSRKKDTMAAIEKAEACIKEGIIDLREAAKEVLDNSVRHGTKQPIATLGTTKMQMGIEDKYAFARKLIEKGNQIAHSYKHTIRRSNDPLSLILDKIKQVINAYRYLICTKNEEIAHVYYTKDEANELLKCGCDFQKGTNILTTALEKLIELCSAVT